MSFLLLGFCKVCHTHAYAQRAELWPKTQVFVLLGLANLTSRGISLQIQLCNLLCKTSVIIAHSLRDQTNEGAQRTCLGRAYYYIYNLALAKATKLGFKRRPNSSLHKQLWDWYQKQPDPDIKLLGITGNDMKSLRVDADYHNNITDLTKKVKTQLERAQEFEALVFKSNGQPPPPPLP